MTIFGETACHSLIIVETTLSLYAGLQKISGKYVSQLRNKLHTKLLAALLPKEIRSFLEDLTKGANHMFCLEESLSP